MADPLDTAIDAHGGLDRWNQLSLSARLIQGGALWGLRGQAGGTSPAHYVSDYADVAGITLPTKNLIFPRGPDGRSLAEPLVVSIDLSAIAFT